MISLYLSLDAWGIHKHQHWVGTLPREPAMTLAVQSWCLSPDLTWFHYKPPSRGLCLDCPLNPGSALTSFPRNLTLDSSVPINLSSWSKFSLRLGLHFNHYKWLSGIFLTSSRENYKGNREKTLVGQAHQSLPCGISAQNQQHSGHHAVPSAPWWLEYTHPRVHCKQPLSRFLFTPCSLPSVNSSSRS